MQHRPANFNGQSSSHKCNIIVPTGGALIAFDQPKIECIHAQSKALIKKMLPAFSLSQEQKETGDTPSGGQAGCILPQL